MFNTKNALKLICTPNISSFPKSVKNKTSNTDLLL